MSTAVWVAVVGLIITVIIQAVGLVIWGARLTQRVNVLEDEVEPLKALAIQIARMEVKQDQLFEQLKELSASVRWMRDPAPPYRATMPRGQE